MSPRRYIYWRPDIEKDDLNDGKMAANVHLLVGYTQCSLANFQQMADDLRKSFPEATYDEIYVAKIKESSDLRGYFMVIWNARIYKKNYPHWVERDFDSIKYSW